MAVVRKILMVIALIRAAYGLSCTSCDTTACAKPLNCKAGLVKGLCGCCDVCAKVDNERCGGPWYIHGKCAEGLKCVTRTQLEKRDKFLPEYFKTGVCKSDACQNVTCGFRQKCKINKRGKPVCVCPRRCGKAKYPVCGLLNGKRYRNKCRLEREECLSKTEIGIITGDCKKCIYNRKEFKFGERRPDAKACETCICHHGLWKCDIKPSCFLNNLPIRSEHVSCLVSQDEKTHVLPCPKGFSCRILSSENTHDSYRAGVCKPKPKKVKKPKKVFLEEQRDVNSILETDEERLNAEGFAERRMPAESEYRETPVFIEMKTTTSTTPSTSAPSTVKFRNDQQPYGGLMTHVCLAYPDKRSCSTTTSIRWYYNATTRSCVQFSYGECGGSFNNFLSIEKCQEVCQSDSHPTAWPPTSTQPSPMYVSTQRREHHEPGILLHMCHDMKSGMSYRNGESWHVDACTSCSCVSGHALCIAATCPIACLNPVHVDGKCCPICQADMDNEIIVEGEDTRCKDTETELWYYSGESWNKDNCTKCVCVGGEMSCMASVCSKPLCPNPVKKDGICCPVCTEEDQQVAEPTKQKNNIECKDQITGKLYLPGEGWNINDCVSCFCGKDGHQACHESKCSISKCMNPVHLQGRCCPVCPEAFHSACIYDNHQYFQGDFMLLGDMCTLCKCNGNMWNCTKEHCNTTEKDVVVSPKAPYNVKKVTTDNSGFYINTRTTENSPTNDVFGKREDYIIEDPVRMTRRDKKKSIIIQKAKENSAGETETTKLILANMFNSRPTTTSTTSNHVDTEHNNILDKGNEESPWFLEPTKKATENEELPWAKGFNHRMWSSWDELEYTDHVPENRSSTEVYGMKRL